MVRHRKQNPVAQDMDEIRQAGAVQQQMAQVEQARAKAEIGSFQRLCFSTVYGSLWSRFPEVDEALASTIFDAATKAAGYAVDRVYGGRPAYQPGKTGENDSEKTSASKEPTEAEPTESPIILE